MIPGIFISSTVQDLQYLRESMRETLREMGLNPIMSEFGEIGFLPETSVEESCYTSMAECQMAIVIIGKRYGSKGIDNRSITHNEFLVAKDKNIPSIFLVDNEVLSFKRVFDANEPASISPNFPGMDSPTDTFRFIDQVVGSGINNGILPFNTAAEARELVKKQIAHIFGDLLFNRYDPLKLQIRDVLSEIKTLRHELLKDKGDEPRKYLKAMRLLTDETKHYIDYKKFIESITEIYEDEIPEILNSATFDDFLNKHNVSFAITNEKVDMVGKLDKGDVKTAAVFIIDHELKDEAGGDRGGYIFYKNNTLEIEETAMNMYRHLHLSLLQLVNK